MVKPIKRWGYIEKYAVIVKCPNCGKQRKYIPRNQKISGKKVKCFNCNHTFEATKHLIKEVDWGERI